MGLGQKRFSKMLKWSIFRQTKWVDCASTIKFQNRLYNPELAGVIYSKGTLGGDIRNGFHIAVINRPIRHPLCAMHLSKEMVGMEIMTSLNTYHCTVQ